MFSRSQVKVSFHPMRGLNTLSSPSLICWQIILQFESLTNKQDSNCRLSFTALSGRSRISQRGPSPKGGGWKPIILPKFAVICMKMKIGPRGRGRSKCYYVDPPLPLIGNFVLCIRRFLGNWLRTSTSYLQAITLHTVFTVNRIYTD